MSIRMAAFLVRIAVYVLMCNECGISLLHAIAYVLRVSALWESDLEGYRNASAVHWFTIQHLCDKMYASRKPSDGEAGIWFSPR